MAGSLFSVPIFFIVFRETLEAAIIVSVLLSLVEQIVRPSAAENKGQLHIQTPTDSEKDIGDDKVEATKDESGDNGGAAVAALGTQAASDDDAGAGSTKNSIIENPEEVYAPLREADLRKLVRRLRIQIFAGAFSGLIIASAIGAAFIAIWFTQASNLWSKTEALWEAVFCLIAALIILPMALTMLKLDRARAKWRVKLKLAFDKARKANKEGRTGRWLLFGLPFVTVMREGLEAVVFVGGVALGQSARSIPIAAITGAICGLICGFLIYAFASRTALTIFLIVMTNLLLLVGAGLFSRSIGYFELNAFFRLIGKEVDDTTKNPDGPGSFDVRGVVWHINCCNPENYFDNSGWGVFGAVFGWTNTATVGRILSYVFYWLAAIVLLVYMKYAEGRATVLGKESAAGRRRRERRDLAQTQDTSMNVGAAETHE